MAEYCQQCGSPTTEYLEGVCGPCHDDNKSRLDEHNYNYDRWQSMNDQQRDDEIRRAYK